MANRLNGRRNISLNNDEEDRKAITNRRTSSRCEPISSDEEPVDADYLRNIFSDLKKLQSENIFCDVTLKINGSEEFHANKNILSAGSGFFKSMFTSGFSKSNTVEIFIEGGSEVFSILLEFIYTGAINGLTTDNVAAILSMACYLQLAALALQLCRSFIIHTLLKKTTLPLKTACEISQRPEVELGDFVQLIRKYIGIRFCKLAKEPDFLEETTLDCLVICLESIQEHIHDTKTVNDVFTIVDQWLKHQWEARKHCSVTLLTKMKLDSIQLKTLKAFLDSIQDENLPECLQILRGVIEKTTLQAPTVCVRRNFLVLNFMKEAEAMAHGPYTEEEYLEQLSSDLKKLQSENALCDVTLNMLKINESEEFSAHKNILSAGSGFFKSMLTFVKSDTVEIFIEGGSEVFSILLEFIYTGAFNGLTTDNVAAVLSMVCYLQLAPPALQLCRCFILQTLVTNLTSLPLKTACEISQRPEVELADLVQLIRKYIGIRFCNLAKEPDFLEETTLDCLVVCLESIQEQTHDTKTVNKVFTIVDKWLKHQWEARKHCSVTLLTKMKLDSIQLETLKAFLDSIQDENLPECLQILNEVIEMMTLQAPPAYREDNIVCASCTASLCLDPPSYY
ncbi:uncharacterized protein [Amphiura filiformis]|uniref:uncharacterized protein n=1 Tax=Amphiura filiformis TaxID=82378 RepID=UPI003B21F9F3